MELGWVRNVEYANVAIPSDDPPQMPPFIQLLKFLRTQLFPIFQIRKVDRIETMRKSHIHFDFKQHLSPRIDRPAGDNTDRARDN